MRKIILIILVLGLGIFLTDCAKVPFTGRRQAKLIPATTINSLSFQQYDDFLKQNPPVKSGNDYQKVRQIGGKLVQALEVYFKANGLQKELLGFNWEFNVVENDSVVNAFCMPGGKVVVYTGILPVAKDDDGLAVIMGHEIAHAVAHHGNERMTQQLGLQGAITAIDTYMAYQSGQANTAQEQAQREATRQAVMVASGIGAQVGILLPFSRKHESEADKIGLYLMAIAGYDVNAAAPFWDRMQALGSSPVPQFLSTHPSPETRSNNLKEWAPEAKNIGKQYSIK